MCGVGEQRGKSKHEERKGVGITQGKDGVLLILEMNRALFLSHAEL